jgi:transcriptional antiterminator RfaH
MNASEAASWYAVRTKPRQEGRAAKNLAAWGIETFAPRLAPGKNEWEWKSFFPGYIFARLNANQLGYKIQFTRGVAEIVSVRGMPAAIDDEVIEAIRRRADKDGVVRLFESLRPGDRLLIQAGPLKNFIGVFQGDLAPRERIRILLKTVSAHVVEVSRLDVSKLPLQPQA